MENPNPHDLLDPETSAQIIRSHTSDGLELARKHHLPRSISAFITEHHGTSQIGYFYHKACKEYGKENVDRTLYQHLGPRPQTKETAIVMMADGCEAAVRSVRPQDAKALEELVRSLIGKMIAAGQLNVAPLTLQEIDTIASSFVNTLQGVFHPRIRYPSGETGQERRTERAARLPSQSAPPQAGTSITESPGAGVLEDKSPRPLPGTPQERGQTNGRRIDSS
jgi:membrane-associated HD superfamily phosphohydrolase